MKRLLFFTCLFISISAFGQAIDLNGRIYLNPSYYPAIDQAKIRLLDIMDKYHIPGLSAAVSVGGEIVWAEALGIADMEDSTPVRLKSKFRIGSVSKSITGVLTGKLFEEESLDIDAPISNYLPDFPSKGYDITARQLAGHLSGIRHYDDSKGEYFSRTHYERVRDALEVFSHDSLHFEPGTKYEYTTYGYSLLSAVIENAAGEDFLELVNEKILIPSGMNSTAADENTRIIADRVKFYSFEKGRLVNAYFVDNSNKWAGGGFLSTPVDLVKFGNALLSGILLKPETLQMVLTSQRLKNGQATGYGFGFSTGKDESGRNRVYHLGSSVGGRTVFILYPAEKVVIAVTCNLLAGFNQKEIEEIGSFFIETYFANLPKELPASGSGE